MENIEVLKLELLKQKQVIEDKSGFVATVHENPSPAEITEGIKTIPSTDLSIATATEEDVVYGKTFFAGNSQLKTGVNSFNPLTTTALFMYNDQKKLTEEDIYYIIPSGTLKIRKYCFYDNWHKVSITFNDDLKQIEDYAFYQTKNFTFNNFNELKQITKIGSHSFAYNQYINFDIGNLPNTISTISTNAFAHSISRRFDFKFPTNISSVGDGAYRSGERVNSGTLDMSQYKISTTANNLFYYHGFDCDLSFSESVVKIGANFNYNGSFKNITFHSNIGYLNGTCFGGISSLPLTHFYLNTVTFEGETPPVFGSNVFAMQNISNGFKIYVPDNSVEAYKSASNFAQYAECVYPMSQKE